MEDLRQALVVCVDWIEKLIQRPIYSGRANGIEVYFALI
jgi:hypothetical protein